MQVSRERWQEAQEWEQAVWDSANAKPTGRAWLRQFIRRRVPYPGDDWNHWWRQKFDHYRSIPAALDNVVEFGCGPYTNMRLFLEGRTAQHVHCSDPLIRRYIMYKGRWLAEAHRAGKILIDDHPLEECPFSSRFFDAVLVINVLDHVMDAAEALRQAVRVTKVGGFLILGQDLSDTEDIMRMGYDPGHPIRLVHDEVLEHLQGYEPVLQRVLPRSEGRAPANHYGTLIFIGRRNTT